MSCTAAGASSSSAPALLTPPPHAMAPSSPPRLHPVYLVDLFCLRPPDELLMDVATVSRVYEENEQDKKVRGVQGWGCWCWWGQVWQHGVLLWEMPGQD